jgi:hypothetical protein
VLFESSAAQLFFQEDKVEIRRPFIKTLPLTQQFSHLPLPTISKR